MVALDDVETILDVVRGEIDLAELHLAEAAGAETRHAVDVVDVRARQQ